MGSNKLEYNTNGERKKKKKKEDIEKDSIMTEKKVSYPISS